MSTTQAGPSVSFAPIRRTTSQSTQHSSQVFEEERSQADERSDAGSTQARREGKGKELEEDRDRTTHENLPDTFPELMHVTGPVDSSYIIGDAEPAIIDIDLLRSPYKYATSDKLNERRRFALLLGSESIGRHIDENKPTFSRKLRKDIFFIISNRLDFLLTNISRYKTIDSFVFSIQREEYSDLLRALYKIMSQLEHIARIDGVVPPELPIWGNKGDIDARYDENDFEILGACFRTEVEHFLMFYDGYYNFLTDTVRGEENQQIEVQPTSETMQRLHERPPHMPDLRPPSNASSQERSSTFILREGTAVHPIRGPRRSGLYSESDAMARLKSNTSARQNLNAPTARLRDTLSSMRPQYDLDVGPEGEFLANINTSTTRIHQQPTSTPINQERTATFGQEEISQWQPPLFARQWKEQKGSSAYTPWQESNQRYSDRQAPSGLLFPTSRPYGGENSAPQGGKGPSYGPYYGGEGGTSGGKGGSAPYVYGSAAGLPRGSAPRSGGPDGGGPGGGGGHGGGGPGGGGPGGGGSSGGGPGGGGPNGSGPGGGGGPGGGPGGGGAGGGGPGGGGPGAPYPVGGAINAREAHFDIKLKIDSVPTWNGDTDTLVRWITKVNNLASMSHSTFTQLGMVVPRRLEGSAEIWYWSLPANFRRSVERNWDTLRTAITGYYMNRRWLDKQKTRALRAYYREPPHSKETPSEYYIRKRELLDTVLTLDDSELITEIMEGAPANWNTILTTQLYDTAMEFQTGLRFYEETLMRLDESQRTHRYDNPYRDSRPYAKSEKRSEDMESARNSTKDTGSRTYKPWYASRTNAVGAFSTMETPKFPKDDTTLTKRKNSPDQVGARPCRHCGSGKHWDYECRHSFKGTRAARVNLATVSEEEHQAEDSYNELYYSLDDAEYLTEDTEEVSQASTAYLSHGGMEHQEVQESMHAAHVRYGETSIKQPGFPVTRSPNKLPLNRRSRRRLARDIESANTYQANIQEWPSEKSSGKEIIALPKYMSRPPGCSFLGSKATQVEAWVGSREEEKMRIIVDSGSDITLISETALNSLLQDYKVRKGQKIELVQVTGTSSISGFVTLDVYFSTVEGIVKLSVEAYVVRGMTTPFILGNDFADQYSISTISKEGISYLEFGNSGYRIQVENSTGSSLIDAQGRTFRIRARSPVTGRALKARSHRRNQRIKHRQEMRSRNNEVRAAERVVIPPASSKKVRVNTSFPQYKAVLFVERRLLYVNSPDQAYGAPDTLINSEDPFLHVSNFSTSYVTVAKGALLGTCRDPETWLDNKDAVSKRDYEKMRAHASFVRELTESRYAESTSEVSSKAQRNATEKDDPLAEEPIEGGPKTAEIPPEDIEEDQLLAEVKISKDLTESQYIDLAKVITDNKDAFGLNGRLGNYDVKVEIRMKENTTPVSLPPFPASPAKREVIDKQMDSWIKLGVIEPSRSPWAAPVFIVYRNNKPRMVIDLRKFNESVIPDEFPLPKQEDILQALSGAQWLTTLDALAGFTQLTMSDSASEKLAFRTHRGLWQFRRMPFGYRNGPSVFQRVMQNVLAPFLWIFALVYIDDIVVFSLTFEDHLKHLKEVFKAISRANITLSPPKCHFAYQSLLLLGQKVSRLGLSTHKEKVQAITELEEPKNRSDLQTFLGMMGYFASYIHVYT